MSTKTLVSEVLDLLHGTYDFRRNEINDRLEVKLKTSNIWKEASILSLWMSIAKKKDVPLDVVSNIIGSPDFAEPYNPFKDWIESLPVPEDGEGVFRKLAGYIVLVKNDSYEKERLVLALKKWFVSSIRAVYEKDFVPKHCLVLIGEQGIGKTPFLRNFMPPHLKGSELENPPTSNPERLAESLVAFIEEINAWLKLDSNEPRHQQFLSSTGTEKKRIASFLACSENADFLKREGGTDRFVCFKIEKIWNYRRLREEKELKRSQGERFKSRNPAEEADITSVWAAAYKLYKAGYEASYSTTETKWMRRANKLINAIDSTLEIFYKFFEPKSPGDSDASFFNATEIATILNDKQNHIKFNPLSLGKLLSQEGLKKYYVNRQNGYYLAVIEQ